MKKLTRLGFLGMLAMSAGIGMSTMVGCEQRSATPVYTPAPTYTSPAQSRGYNDFMDQLNERERINAEQHRQRMDAMAAEANARRMEQQMLWDQRVQEARDFNNRGGW